MKTEHRFAEALKQMMAVQPLNSISVMSLAKKCNVDRKTFYYHFHDIYDLLALVFLDEKIKDINEVKNIDELLTVIFTYYTKNESFIDATLSSAGKDLLLEFVYNNCYSVFLRLVINCDKDRKLHITDRKNLARYYASAYSYSIIYYLNNYKHKSLEGLKQIFDFKNKDDPNKATLNLIKIRSAKEKTK